MTFDLALRFATICDAASAVAKHGNRFLTIIRLYPEKLSLEDWVNVETVKQHLHAALAPTCPIEDPHGGAIPIYERTNYRAWFESHSGELWAIRSLWATFPAIMPSIHKLRDDPHDDGELMRLKLLLQRCESDAATIRNAAELLNPVPGRPLISRPKYPAIPVRRELPGNDAPSGIHESDGTEKKLPPRWPDNPDVKDLCALLAKKIGSGKSEAQIAREFTGESPRNDRKAKNLLRQARRFRHLWKG